MKNKMCLKKSGITLLLTVIFVLFTIIFVKVNDNGVKANEAVERSIITRTSAANEDELNKYYTSTDNLKGSYSQYAIRDYNSMKKDADGRDLIFSIIPSRYFYMKNNQSNIVI